MKRILIVTLAAAAAGIAPGWAAAGTFKGIVVARSSARGTVAVASPRGVVHTLHVRRLARIGSIVTTGGARRADGTYKASRVSVRGRAHRARIHGVVVARVHGRMLLSAGHSMILVRSRARRLASARDGSPAVGTVVDTEVEIRDNGDLDEEDTTELGEDGTVEIEGTVVSVDAGSIQVRTEGGVTVKVVVPATIHLSLSVGDEVELKATVEGSTLTLVSAETEDDQGDDEGDDSSDD